MTEFSVLMSVYKNDDPNYFCEAIDSIINQTLKPNEIVLVRDGIVPPEYQEIIDKYIVNYPNLINYIPLEKNLGSGKAKSVGFENAKYDIVCIMDADDIAVENRFELQIKYIEEHPDVSILGGQIEEFIGNKENIVSKRITMLSDEDIKKRMKKRNPFNHVTIAYRKKDVLEAGNYEQRIIEDYYVALKMMVNKCKFANIPETLVLVRIDNMQSRRCGFTYFKEWISLENYKLSNRITNIIDYISTLSMRFVLHVMLNEKIRNVIFEKFSRKTCN